MTRLVTGRTRVAAVLGQPVQHSLSPVIHNAGFESLDVDWIYVALPTPLERLENVLAMCRAEALAGVSVTMPLKTAAFEAMDELSPAARVLRSVNTISIDGGRLTGHSTDGDGLVDSLVDESVKVAGSSILLLGWGGAARSVADAVLRAGAREVVVTNRSGVDPADLADVCPLATSMPWERRDEETPRFDVVINCTSVGMDDDRATPVDVDRLSTNTAVVDLVYHPMETSLLAGARRRGCTVVGGLGMLVHQAARQQEIWLGRRPDPAVMKAAALQALADRR